MDNLIKVNVTAVSNVGMGYSDNQDNFYLNGRTMYEHEMENIQVSLESSAEDQLFAVSDGMDRTVLERRASISMVKELKKFQDQIKGNGGDLEGKLRLFKERLEETNNIIYSLALNAGIDENGINRDDETGFAGILMSGKKAAAIHMGKNRVYLLRDGSIRQLTGDTKKADKLLKMGIITNEQASVLSGKYGISSENIRTEIQRSEAFEVKIGDMFLLCSNGLINVVDDEKINEILSLNNDTGYVSNMLVKEVLKNNGKDNITVVVVRVDQINVQVTSVEKTEKHPVNRIHRQGKNKKRENIRTLIAAAIVILVAASILVFAYNKIKDNDTKDEGLQVVQGENAIAEPETDTVNIDTEVANQGTEDQPTSKIDPSGDSEEKITLPTTHTVQKGDTFQRISKKYYNTIDKYKLIMEKNHITNDKMLIVGKVLIIP